MPRIPESEIERIKRTTDPATPSASAARERFRATARHAATQMDIEEAMWAMLGQTTEKGRSHVAHS